MLQPKDTDWLTGFKNKTDIHAVCATYFRAKHIQTESERIEKFIPYKWEAKEGWSSNPHIRQNRP